MAQQLIDQLIKTMAEYHAEDFIWLAFPGANFKIISTRLEKELVVKTRIADSVIKIATDAGEHLVHFEFQTEYQADIAKRIFIYAGALTAKYNLDVTSILFQLRPVPAKSAGLDRYNVNLFGMVTNFFGFHCVKLYEYQQEILSGKPEYLGFVPLLLELTAKPDENLLKKQRELIQKEQDLKRRTELTGLCLALASKHFDFSFLTEFFKEDIRMLEGLEQVPYIGEKIKNARSEGMEKGIQQGMEKGIQKGMEKGIQQGMQKGIQQGMEKGIQQGVQKGISDMIIETIKTRFNTVDGVDNLILTITDLPTLKRVFQLAITTDSLEAFKNAVAELLSK